MKRTVLVVGLLVAAACSSQSTTASPSSTTAAPTTSSSAATSTTAAPTSTSKMTLSEAWCSDLAKGYTPFQIWRGVKDDYPDVKEFADKAYGMTAISCPEQLKTNEPLRTWLQGWGINPDV